MKAYFFFVFIIFKIIFFSYFFTYTSSLGNEKEKNNEEGECKAGNTKNSCLNNIIIFENTKGDIYLMADDIDIIFGTTFSNNDQCAIYAITYANERYIIEKDNNLVPFLIKNISQSEIKEISNGDLSIYKQNKNNIIIFIFGTDGSYIEILKINHYSNDFILVSPNDFINEENKVIKGISSLFYINYDSIIYGTVTVDKNNISDHYLSLYGYTFYFIEENENKLKFEYTLKYKIEYNDIKGEFLSCFIFDNNNYLSCFYLSKDNNYTIILIKTFLNSQNELIEYSIQKSIIVGSPSNPTDENFYFLKGISLGSNNFIYKYYSGDSNDVPTFLFKTIDLTDFILSVTYSNFPVIYLDKKYQFNNGIKYNDLSFSDNKIYFVSSSKNKETIIL